MMIKSTKPKDLHDLHKTKVKPDSAHFPAIVVKLG